MTLTILLSLIDEGPTDYRFLSNITERVIEQMLLNRNVKATIQWQPIAKEGKDSIEKIVNAAKQAKFCTTLIVHADADKESPATAFNNRVKPGLEAIERCEEVVCRNITVVIPVTETEAWMLADKELLKEEMNTRLSDHDLGLDFPLKQIEEIRDPKQKLIDAINVHRERLSRKKRKRAVEISELYEPISQKIELKKLEVLEAFMVFKSNLTAALRHKNIIQ